MVLRPWDDPAARVRRYMVEMATHWQLHPRAVDTLTLDEFDTFARMADEIARERAEQQRQADAAARRR